MKILTTTKNLSPLNSAMKYSEIKFLEYNTGKLSNTSNSDYFSYYIPASYPSSEMIVAYNWHGKSGGTFSVMGRGRTVWIQAEPGFTVDNIMLLLIYKDK